MEAKIPKQKQQKQLEIEFENLIRRHFTTKQFKVIGDREIQCEHRFKQYLVRSGFPGRNADLQTIAFSRFCEIMRNYIINQLQFRSLQYISLQQFIYNNYPLRNCFSYLPSKFVVKICRLENIYTQTSKAFHASVSQCKNEDVICIHLGKNKQIYIGHHKIGKCKYSTYHKD